MSADSQQSVVANGLMRGNIERVSHLMRYHHGCDVVHVSQLDDFIVHRSRRYRIEAGGWEVIQKSSSLGFAHRPGNRDAASLATRQLGWHPVDEFLHPDEIQNLFDALAHLIVRHVGFLIQSIPDVFRDGQRVEERAFLKQHPDVRPRARIRSRSDMSPIDWPLTTIVPKCGPEQPQNEFEEGIDLPVPLAPSTIRMLPAGMLKLISPENDMVIERKRHLVEDHGRGALGFRDHTRASRCALALDATAASRRNSCKGLSPSRFTARKAGTLPGQTVRE